MCAHFSCSLSTDSSGFSDMSTDVFLTTSSVTLIAVHNSYRLPHSYYLLEIFPPLWPLPTDSYNYCLQKCPFLYITLVLHSCLQKRISNIMFVLAVCNDQHDSFVATQNKATTKRFKRGKFRILIFAPVLRRITLKTTKISLKLVLSAAMFSMDPALDSGVSHISFNFFKLIRFLFMFFFLKPENYCVNQDIVYTCQ